MDQDINMFLQRWTQFKYLFTINPRDERIKEQLEIFEDVLDGLGITNLKIAALNNSKCHISYIFMGKEKQANFCRDQIDRYIV